MGLRGGLPARTSVSVCQSWWAVEVWVSVLPDPLGSKTNRSASADLCCWAESRLPLALTAQQCRERFHRAILIYSTRGSQCWFLKDERYTPSRPESSGTQPSILGPASGRSVLRDQKAVARGVCLPARE